MLNLEDLSKLSVEQIEKMTQGLNEEVDEIKTRLKKKPIFNNSPIDKFTKIDDLLRQNIALQKDLIEQVHISNKLALATYYKNGITSSVPTDPYGVDTSVLERLKVSSDDYQTLNPIMLNLDGNDAGIRVDGSGIIDTIKFVSTTTTIDNKDYTVEVKCDKTILYNNTFAELEARTGTERGMVCYEDLLAFKYLLIFRTILYTNGFEIRVLNSKAKFELFQVKYHKRV